MREKEEINSGKKNMAGLIASMLAVMLMTLIACGSEVVAEDNTEIPQTATKVAPVASAVAGDAHVQGVDIPCAEIRAEHEDNELEGAAQFIAERVIDTGVWAEASAVMAGLESCGINIRVTATPAPTATAVTSTKALEPSITNTARQPGPTWRGLTIAPENRCSPYDSAEYRYSQLVEARIVNAQGGIYGPYTGTWFNSTGETDIEHILARSEAHDSGLCAASRSTKAQFSSDLLNLTLASPSVNRHRKVAKDVREWLPALNQCWYVDRTIQVRQKYGLTIDRAEAEAADRVLAGCESTEMVVLAPRTSTSPAPTRNAAPASTGSRDALRMYDDNGNGRITCAEAKAHRIAPVHRGHPAYQYMNDRDGDGVVCE